jgi:hypothetical protein
LAAAMTPRMTLKEEAGNAPSRAESYLSPSDLLLGPGVIVQTRCYDSERREPMGQLACLHSVHIDGNAIRAATL